MKVVYSKGRQIDTTGMSFVELKKLRDKTLTKEQKLKEYRRLSDIKKRCYDPKDKDYKYYGARGIKVCDEWLNDSSLFYVFAFLNGSFVNGMSIDRIDPNKGYSPENCRFVSKKRNATINFIKSERLDAPNFREYRDYGFLFENQYEQQYFGDVSDKFCGHRRRSGWSLYESLKVPHGLTRNAFWNEIRTQKRQFDNEIFLNRTDLKAIYPDEKTSIFCPNCNKNSLYLFSDPKFRVECEKCGFLHYIETK